MNLFTTTTDMPLPSRDFALFKACNDSARTTLAWTNFYAFKDKLLHRFAIPDGYDLQIIVRTCNSCDGTGWFYKNEQCWHCSRGIYRTDHVALQRFILNGSIFHIPLARVYKTNPKTFEHNGKEYEIKNDIHGLVKHSQPDINGLYAYFCLLYIYDRELFFPVLSSFASGLQTRTQAKWKSLMRKYNQFDALAKFFEVDENKILQIHN